MSFDDELRKGLEELRKGEERRKQKEQDEQAVLSQSFGIEETQRKRKLSDRAIAIDRFIKAINAREKFDTIRRTVWGLGKVEYRGSSVSLTLKYSIPGKTQETYPASSDYFPPSTEQRFEESIRLVCECDYSNQELFILIFTQGDGTDANLSRLIISASNPQEASNWLDKVLLEDSLERAKQTGGRTPIYPIIL